MMDYLIRKLGVNYDNFVQNLWILQDVTADDISADSMEGDYGQSRTMTQADVHHLL